MIHLTSNAIIAAVMTLAMNTPAQEADLAKRIESLESKIALMETQDSKSLRGYWKNGFILEQPDKAFKLQVGGRMQMDTAFFSADDTLDAAKGPFDDGIKFRRARFFLRGTMYDNLEFFMEYDFAGGSQFRTIYMGVSDVPVLGNVRAGHLLEPFGLEEFSSNNHLTFMERGGPTVFSPIRNSGIMAFNTGFDQRATWAAGIFKDTGTFGDSVSNEEFAVTARLTGLPYFNENGREYLHLGSCYSHRNLNEEGYRVRSRPDSYIAPYVVDTKSMPSDSVDIYSLETLWSLGSFYMQGEWGLASVDRLDDEEGAALSEADLQAYYIMASYILTGEHKPYVKSNGTFTRITPKQNATGKNWGAGAWEVAARYNVVDLNDADLEGGNMDSYTLGLNWHLNPHAKIMWNYVMADVEDLGDVDVYQMRFQFDF
jgi:phosphate-selective porin OprO/OprP